MLKKITPFILITAILAGLLIYFFADVIFVDRTLSYRDLFRYFYPLRYYTVDLMKKGIVPLWNPYIFCGTPHLALQQSVVFYPLSIIYYIIPFDTAFDIFLIAHLFLAGIFVTLLGRRWNLSYPASALAAIMFMFSGYVIFVMNLATTLSSVIWLPLVLFFFDKALNDGSMKSACLAGLFLGVMFLGGEPSIFLSTLWFILFYVLFFSFNGSSRGERIHMFKKAAGYYAAASIIGALVASIQMIPFLELVKFTDRARVAGLYDYLTLWSFHPKDTIDFLIPFFARTDFSNTSYWKEQNWVVFVYMGAFSLLLAAASFVFRKDWRIKFLFFTGTLYLFIAYGRYAPLYYVINKFVPGFQLVRYPVRFLYVTTFAIAMLSGWGYDAFRERRVGAGVLLFVLFMASLALAAVHLYGASIAMTNLGRFLGFFVSGGLILYLCLKRKVGKPFLDLAFISLVVIDIFTVIPDRSISLDTAIFHRATPNIEYLKRDGSLFRFLVSPKTKEKNVFLDEAKRYEDGIEIMKDRLIPDTPMLYGLYDAYGYDSIELARNAELMGNVFASKSPASTKILNMLNVKYVVAIDELKEDGYKLVNKGSAYLYENTKVLPRAFLAASFNVIKKEKDIINYITSKGFDPMKEVVLEEEPVLKGQGSRVKGQGEEKVEIVKYSPNEVVIKAVVNSPKFLVLSDSYYRGWKAYVDGRRDKIYVADYALRSVRLNAGEHTVRFVFDPLSFKVGASLSIATLFLLALYIVIKKRYDII